jgi:hypothetical protein
MGVISSLATSLFVSIKMVVKSSAIGSFFQILPAHSEIPGLGNSDKDFAQMLFLEK